MSSGSNNGHSFEKQVLARRVMESMKANNNGSYSDYQRILDIVREHDEPLADAMLEMVDDDPARKQYKKRLELRVASSKKIEAAKNNLAQVNRLNTEEQMRFFDRQMEELVKKKSVVKDFNSTQSIIAAIYEDAITDTKNAVLFFMENLCQRYIKSNKLNKFKDLLIGTHKAVTDNLKLVLAIASGTKES